VGGLYRMASTLTLATEDGAYTYTNDMVNDKYHDALFRIENNNKKTNTQGYLIKVQKGDRRIRATVDLADTAENLEANLFPMLTYQATLNCTFDRNILTRGTNTGKFELTDMELLQEFENGTILEIKLTLTEVIGT
jgi:hypothetical protein